MVKHLLIASVCVGTGPLVRAESTNGIPVDKSCYTLLNPTPDRDLRELSPDRPDETESPITVDAGHIQLETDFLNYAHDQNHGVRSEAWNIAPFNFKVGLLNRVDVQFVYDSYIRIRATDPAEHSTATESGFGDFTTRLKINLWGDDGGQTAFALLPYVKWPTSTGRIGNDAVEGGWILPLAVDLPAGFGMGCETGVGFWRDADGNHYHEEFVNSITFDHAIAGPLGGFLEFYSAVSTERHSGWIGTVDTGLEYLVTKNIQLDADCYFGVTSAASDFNPFSGMTVRF